MNPEDITKGMDECLEILKEVNRLSPSDKQVSIDELTEACQKIQEIK